MDGDARDRRYTIFDEDGEKNGAVAYLAPDYKPAVDKDPLSFNLAYLTPTTDSFEVPAYPDDHDNAGKPDYDSGGTDANDPREAVTPAAGIEITVHVRSWNASMGNYSTETPAADITGLKITSNNTDLILGPVVSDSGALQDGSYDAHVIGASIATGKITP